MRNLPMTAVVFAAAVLGSGVALGAERGWIVQAGGGPAGSSNFGIGPGRAAFLAVATPLRPWFLFGAQVTAFRYEGGSGGTMIPELDSSSDPSDAIALATTFRLQVPVHSRLAPFVVAESGLGWTRQGDTRQRNIFTDPIQTWTIRGRRQIGLCSTAGLGLRAVVPGAWPDVEGSLRHTMWAGDPTVELGEWRLSLAW